MDHTVLDLPGEAIREIRTRCRHGVVDPIGGAAFDYLAWAVRDVNERRRLRLLIKSAGPALPIARAEEGAVRVDGRIDVLEPPLPSHPSIAAYAIQRSSDGACGCKPDCKAVRRTVAIYEGVGRFTVRGEDEAALIVGPHVRIVDEDVRRPDVFGAGALLAQQDDAVTIIGPATRRNVEGGPRMLGVRSGYRRAHLPLVFQGTKTQPVHILSPQRPG